MYKRIHLVKILDTRIRAIRVYPRVMMAIKQVVEMLAATVAQLLDVVEAAVAAEEAAAAEVVVAAAVADAKNNKLTFNNKKRVNFGTLSQSFLTPPPLGHLGHFNIGTFWLDR